ncbi:hypothetical protein [Pseudomonas typographi]|uniref:DUF1566 domain-containing protein n=1 Tax=Pseudomonas typographi TaxID=2715964 RepID=A0ABR7Z6N6_9PSED|nr:hypothetical protein [Pseudomonas typographi]MBD1601153.1 hypothetical protein [Pseudomonas typographi]
MKRREISPAALPAIGHPLAGGFFAGRLYFNGAEHALIDAGQDFECEARWWDHDGPRPRIHGATCRYDGLANTLAMANEGSTIAKKVLSMNVRGTWGWYIPSIEELQLMRTNLLQLPDWFEGPARKPQGFQCSHDYWSSTQKNHAATAWCMTMMPWCVPDSNWVSGSKGIRPVKSLVIKPEAFIHAPHFDDLQIVARTFTGLTDSDKVAQVVERFVNEDSGRFYGRTDELVAALAEVRS